MKSLIILAFLISVNAKIIGGDDKFSSRIATEVQNAQSEEAIVKSIRQKYLAINERLKSLRKVVKDFPYNSSEGGELNGYYDGKALKKMRVVYYGEMGKAEHEYYFEKDQMIFQFWRVTSYDKPMYIKDFKIKSVKEDRFYFKDGNLIKWIKPGNKIVNVKSSDFNYMDLDLKLLVKEFKEKLSQN